MLSTPRSSHGSIDARVFELLRRELGYETFGLNISRSDRLIEDLALDSMSIVTIQVALEDQFGIRFDPLQDDMVAIFQTVGSLIDHIKKRSSAE